MKNITINFKIFPALVLFAISALLLNGCTTATYGRGFVKNSQIADQYSLRVYVGGLSGGDVADKRAKQEVAKYIAQKEYSSYKIINRRYNFVPSYFEYTIRFYRKH